MGAEAVPCWKGFPNHCHAPSKRLIQLGLAVKPGKTHTRSWDPHPVFSGLSWEGEFPFMCFTVLSTVAQGEGTAQGVPGVGMEVEKQDTRHQESTNHIRQTLCGWKLCLSTLRAPLMEAAEVSLGSQLQQLPVFNASHALFYYTSNPLCLQSRKSCQRPLIQTEFNLSNSIYSDRAAKSIY